MTQFSVGFLDSIFGEKLELELPTEEGGVVKRQVTKKWLGRMIHEGRIRKADGPPEKASMQAQFTREHRVRADSGTLDLETRAERLVDVAVIQAVGLSIPGQSPLLARFPFLEEAVLQSAATSWDVLAITACLSCGQFALARLAESGKLTTEQYLKLSRIVFESFTRTAGIDSDRAEFDPFPSIFENVTEEYRLELVQDCSTFIGVAAINSDIGKTEQTLVAAVGVWVLRNLYGREISEEEGKAATAIGYLLGSEFLLWWDETQWPELSGYRRRVNQYLDHGRTKVEPI